MRINLFIALTGILVIFGFYGAAVAAALVSLGLIINKE